MTVLLSYFWPVFAAGLAIGGVAGAVGFRLPQIATDRPGDRDALLNGWRRKQRYALTLGLLVTLASAALWHAPLGGADRFTRVVERSARQALDYYEMFGVTARLGREPLTRRLQLSGPADDFQRSELVRIMGDLPGVSVARWHLRDRQVPLIGEGALMAILGFLVGLLLAYLIELRRRYNAQWSW